MPREFELEISKLACAKKIQEQYWPRIDAINKEKERKLKHMKRGDELQSGVLEKVVVYLANKAL